MSSFTTPLIVEPINNRQWELIDEFSYYTNLFDKSTTIIVPKGFITDFASVPRFLWSIFPPWDKYGKAAVLHDYLYSYQIFERKICDRIFYEAMTVLGVPWWKRKVMYLAVRVFGESHYKK